VSDSKKAPLPQELASPGALLKAAREKAGISEKEAAAELNLIPGYISLIEKDDYEALRSPAFARGYVKAYGRFLGVNEIRLLSEYDERQAEQEAAFQRRRIETRQLHLHRSGAGVAIGLTILVVMVFALWWGQRDIPLADIEHAGSVQQLPVNTESPASLGN
jgi:cytoskeletal protein RodZ